ncbi:MAG: hypothetical protein COV76_01435 [Candidatus Omnitrophica bacterium CG11_big_fil_rev_8_21_14_0_20_64_10]|nr:MAG: hypothetical protein COV76_01435 [Candidatus Omnitrophica bacterium CG11_big_fil_rev_8_21_14_0_20_64_10]
MDQKRKNVRRPFFRPGRGRRPGFRNRRSHSGPRLVGNKIVISHVPAGSGHLRAAAALVSTLQQQLQTTQVQMLNALDGADPFFKSCYGKGYEGIVQWAAPLWGLIYHLSNLPGFDGLYQRLHRWTNAAHVRGLERLILKSRPNIFIATHFMPAEVAGAMRVNQTLRARVISVITDYMPHAVWIAPGIDTYAVGSEEARQELIRRGVPESKILFTGIPIDPRFLRGTPKGEACARLGLESSRFTVLIGSGGMGNGPVTQIVQALGRINRPLQIIVVAGHNDALFSKLERLSRRIAHPMRLYGYINHMHELMDAADVMITKPGGLSCTEAMVKGLPMLLNIPIPGQEARNARLLEKLGIVRIVGRAGDFSKVVEGFMQDGKELQQLAEAGRRFASAQAAEKIVRLALSALPKQGNETGERIEERSRPSQSSRAQSGRNRSSDSRSAPSDEPGAAPGDGPHRRGRGRRRRGGRRRGSRNPGGADRQPSPASTEGGEPAAPTLPAAAPTPTPEPTGPRPPSGPESPAT